MDQKELGIIESTSLGHDHGCLTFWLTINFGGRVQGFGGYALDDVPLERKPGSERRGTVKGLEVISKILSATGSENWESLKGKTIWVTREGTEWGSKIIEIEAPNFVSHGKPFNIIEHFKE